MDETIPRFVHNKLRRWVSIASACSDCRWYGNGSVDYLGPQLRSAARIVTGVGTPKKGCHKSMRTMREVFVWWVRRIFGLILLPADLRKQMVNFVYSRLGSRFAGTVDYQAWKAWQTHQDGRAGSKESSGASKELVAARDGTSCILIVDIYPPQPDRDAGSRTIMAFIRRFQELGFSVNFWALAPWYDPNYVQLLEQQGVRFLGHGKCICLEAWLTQCGSRIRYVLLSRLPVALQCARSLRRYTNATLLFYGHDISYVRLGLEAKVTRSLLTRFDASLIRRLEHGIWRRVDVILYPSPDEAAQVRALLPAKPAYSVPAFAIERFTVDAASNLADRRDILFVGGFGHRPNVDAASWFAKEIFSRIAQERPDVVWHLVGANPTADVFALGGPRIRIVGQVSEEELSAYYRRCRVVVVPLRFGAGVKGKVVEACSYGVPVVMTPIGAQGLCGVESIAKVAEEPGAFASSVLSLLTDDAAWRRMSAQEVEFVRKRFSIEAMRAGLEKIVGRG